MNEAKPFNKIDQRMLITFAVLAAVLAYFWTSSRYPALNEKAMMGGDTPMAGLAFDIVFEVLPESPLWWEFTAGTINWIATNINGMTFGVIFGALMLTFLSLVKNRSFENGFANAALGTVIGAPLGVCVNCAAPIALGLHMGRMRLETTLAAMIASPTLNVIVVTMSFALLPVHVALTKLLLALVMVLLIIPLLCRYLLKSETEKTKSKIAKMAEISEPTGLSAWVARALAPQDAGTPTVSLVSSLLWFVKSFARNLFFIFIVTVPLMLVAAMLGALVTTFFDSQELLFLLPRSPILTVLAVALLLACIACFAPAPIALDVILIAVLLGVGLSTDYATVLLISLGSFSIYAFFILWRFVSPRTAIVVFISTVGLSLTGGAIAHATADFEREYLIEQNDRALASMGSIESPVISALPAGRFLADLKPSLALQTIRRAALTGEIKSDRSSSISVSIYEPPELPAAAVPSGSEKFTRIKGSNLGFEETGINTPFRETAPDMYLGGIASGDIHNDGWDDIVVRRPTGAKGLSLYANLDRKFERQEIDLGVVADATVLNVALVDIDNDAWQDLIVTTKTMGNFIFYNEMGDFSPRAMTRIPLPQLTMTMAIGFADLNQDGALEIILGNWVNAQGFEGWDRQIPVNTRNMVAWNLGDRRFAAKSLAGSAGQTLAVLALDIDGDGTPEVLKGDDLANTDQFVFLNGEFGDSGKGGRDLQPFPYFMRTSMSYDVGDWNNDLIMDVYGAQISDDNINDRDATRGDGRIFEVCQQIAADLDWPSQKMKECAAASASIDRVRGAKSFGFSQKCSPELRSSDIGLCRILRYMQITRLRAFVRNEISLQEAYQDCRQKLRRWDFTKDWCASFNVDLEPVLTKEALKEAHKPARASGNILMTGQGGGGFRDLAKDQKVDFPGWSWNSRFVDLDQDGWQELLIMNGIWLTPSQSTTNIVYRNNQGKFTDATADFGFYDVVPSYSSVSLDYDGDGDVDIIRPPDGLTMIAHRNDRPAGDALWVRLDDLKGNRNGIGATVSVCVNDTVELAVGPCQSRLIKASGGFMSFDPIQAHFGLGKGNRVSLIHVRWPDGETTKILPEALYDGKILVSRYQ